MKAAAPPSLVAPTSAPASRRMWMEATRPLREAYSSVSAGLQCGFHTHLHHPSVPLLFEVLCLLSECNPAAGCVKQGKSTKGPPTSA
jgi:hypothetical protein|mmetsp:Transcript_61295/g.101650  ORF Transcript_61295/g.101650 Transcript_61295/m.101650 type:complete len:87 (+) Transcript_61295:172-432(+)